MSCATTLERTSSLISILPSCLGEYGSRATRLFKNSCLWDPNKFEAARVISWEHIVISWTRSSTFRKTEFGPKSRDHSKLSLKTENIMILYCRRKVYKMRIWMTFWLAVSTNEVSTWLCHKWIPLPPNNISVDFWHLKGLFFLSFTIFSFCIWLIEMNNCLSGTKLVFFY